MLLRLAALALLCAGVQAQVVLVDETATRAHLVDGHTVVSLALESRVNRPLSALVELAWLDPTNRQQGLTRSHVTIKPGRSAVAIPFSFSEKAGDPLLERLRYRIDPDRADLTAFEGVRGIFDFAAIADYAFATRVIAPNVIAPDKEFALRVLSYHPLTGRPVAGVRFTYGKSEVVANDDGVAVLRLAGRERSDAGVIKAQLGDVQRKQDLPGFQIATEQIKIQCDKPIYQPGQTMHVRVLALGSDGKAEAGAERTLKVFDENEDMQYTANLHTSRFGVAATDWDIPSNAKAGEYRIQIAGEDEDGELPAVRMVSIRRYELPSFRVTVHLDRAYYLPGQTAAIEVHGEYLFGKRLGSGKVRVTEGENAARIAEGELSAAGQFETKLALRETNFGEMRFIDRHFTAYVTDASTNRTEQRHFDLRVSSQSLHVYVAKQESTPGGRRLWIATYTPDGKAASSDVTVFARERALATGRTNRFGVARLDVPAREGELLVRAATSEGAKGEQRQTIYPALKSLWLETERTLYRRGEAVRCRVKSTEKTATALLLAWNARGDLLFSREVRLTNGNAAVDIPYGANFGKEVAIAAVSGAPGPAASRRVLFPSADTLGLRVVPAKDEYRPAETARLEFRTSSQAALGIAIVDQGVRERAAADPAFGARPWLDDQGDERKTLGDVTYADLLNLDPLKIDDDLQLAAEVLVDDPAMPESFDPAGEREQAYVTAMERDLAPVKSALDERYLSTLEYPRDESSFLEAVNPIAENTLDPWMKPYFPRFITEGSNEVLRVCSAGPDKRRDTGDDVCPLEIQRRWLARFESLMREVLRRQQDYPATPEEFAGLLDGEGIRFERLKDPWQHSLRCGVAYEEDRRVVRITSAGPDGKWGTEDDFTVVEFRGSYFAGTAARIERALKGAKRFPQGEGEFKDALAAAGVRHEELRDPWNRGYYLDFHSEESYYDRPRIYTYQEYEGVRESRRELIPAKRTFLVAEIKSAGADGIRGTYDDFSVASFSRAVDKAPASQARPSEAAAPPLLGAPGTGTVAGIVSDRSGASMGQVLVTLNETYTTRTNAAGRYVFSGMPAGYVRLKFQAAAFQTGVLDRVPVEPDHVTAANFTLQIGSVAETVEVAAASPNASSATAQSGAIATPRVREYFPETLYWQPELLTDAAGRAAIEVKLADSITTWHLAVLASTEDGRITETGADIRVFQPFQVDLNAPQVLTEGDEIMLPTPIRNYLAREETVKVTAQAGAGLTLERPITQPGMIEPGKSANVLLPLKAASARGDARLRVAAVGRTASDAIERTVAVHPDGERVERSAAGVIGRGERLRLQIPRDFIAGTLSGEVRIYPTLTARLLDAMQSLLERPYGCGEQTISSTYPNLLFLKALKDGGVHDSDLETRALRNLKAGYGRLLGYQSDSGGFQYWASSSAPDAALTAYALRFLSDAKEFLNVDNDRLEAARAWLKKQKPDQNAVDGLAAWALVENGGKDDSAVTRKLGELARKAEMEDPYAIATFALAALEAGQTDLAKGSIERLTELAKDEGGTAFWALRTNTPFHGWGRAGQVETTAMALSALAKWQKRGRSQPATGGLLQRGALFLLKNVDYSGGWSSPQATVRALLALVEIANATPTSGPLPPEIELLVNGVSAGRVALANRRKTIAGPTILDISKLLDTRAPNELSIRGDIAEPIELQLNAAWYERWAQPGTTKDFALTTELSTTHAAINEAVMCQVNITRPAFRGYGMMIAEVGLPPGAEVDRGTLASIVADRKAGVDSFEVAPDHVTFYVWPQASDSKFQFIFRPRWAMKARTAQSALYDYYNPDQRAVIAPVTFSAQ